VAWDWPALAQDEPIMALPKHRVAQKDLAYILYTSGSTGQTQRVMLTHENATSFVEWCSESFGRSPRIAAHRTRLFHFDLSILDIYMTLKHGATLVLDS
jgi:non-ribosomal peptide synthetase component F